MKNRIEMLCYVVKQEDTSTQTMPILYYTTTSTTTRTTTEDSTSFLLKSTFSTSADGRGPCTSKRHRRLFHLRQKNFRAKFLQFVLENVWSHSEDNPYPLSRCVFILKDVQMNKFDYYTFKSFEKGGWWGFTTSSEVTTWKIGKFSTKVLDSGTNSSRDHIHLYNASEIIRNRKLLGDLFEMTWRWVYMQYNSQYNWSLLYYTRSNGNADNLPLFNCSCLC